MSNKQSEKVFQQIPSLHFFLIIGLFISPMFMLPSVTFDATNLPRLFLLVLLASLCTPYIFKLLRERIKFRNFSGQETLMIIVVASYFLVSIVTANLNLTSWQEELLGDFGRWTGILAYFSLFILFLSATYSYTLQFHKNFKLAMNTSSIVLLSYGSIQIFNLDFIDWDNPFGSPIIGTFGNPNFMSIYLAMTALWFSAQFFYRAPYNKFQIVFCVGYLWSLILLIFNASVQGILGVAIGSIVQMIGVLSIRLRRIAFGIVSALILIATCLLMFLIISGDFRKYVFLYSNLNFRVFAWDTSIRIMLSNPLKGTGFDSIGDWFRFHRNPELANAYKGDNFADASHNVFLDQGVNGGLPLLFLYAMFFLVVSVCAISHFLSESRVKTSFAFLLSAWIVFFINNLVGINQLGIAINGFIFAGLLFGCSISSKATVKQQPKKPQIMVRLAFVLVSLVPGQAVIKDASYLSSLQSGDGQKIIDASNFWPKDDYYLSRTAEIFYKNGYTNLGRDQARATLLSNKRNWLALRLLLADDGVVGEERQELLALLRDTDPISYKSLNAIP